MSTSEWMPKYFYNTQEFSELRRVYSEQIDTTIESCLSVLRSTTNPSKWSDNTINEFMAKCGIWQIYTYDREQKEATVREFLTNKNLMTDQRFANIVKECMEGSPYTIDINRIHNISVTLNASIDDIGTNQITYAGFQTSKFAAIERSIQNNFPAGVRLLMNCNLTDYHKNLVACGCDMAIVFEGQTEHVDATTITLYIGETAYEIEFDFATNKYHIDGEWLSLTGAASLGYMPYPTKTVTYYSIDPWDEEAAQGLWDDTDGHFYLESAGVWVPLDRFTEETNLAPYEEIVTFKNTDPSHTPSTMRAYMQHTFGDNVLYLDEISKQWHTEDELSVMGWLKQEPVSGLTLYSQGILMPNDYVVLYFDPTGNIEHRASVTEYAKLLGQPYTIYDTSGNEIINPLISFRFGENYCMLWLDASSGDSITNIDKVVFEAPESLGDIELKLAGSPASVTIPAYDVSSQYLTYIDVQAIAPMFNMGSGARPYPVSEVLDVSGNVIEGVSVSLDDSGGYPYVKLRNNDSVPRSLHHVKVVAPVTLAYTRNNKLDQSVAPLGYVNLRPYRYINDVMYSSNFPTIAESVEIPCKCFDSNFAEVICNAVVYRYGIYLRLRNKGTQTINVALVRFQFPFDV